MHKNDFIRENFEKSYSGQNIENQNFLYRNFILFPSSYRWCIMIDGTVLCEHALIWEVYYLCGSLSRNAKGFERRAYNRINKYQAACLFFFLRIISPFRSSSSDYATRFYRSLARSDLGSWMDTKYKTSVRENCFSDFLYIGRSYFRALTALGRPLAGWAKNNAGEIYVRGRRVAPGRRKHAFLVYFASKVQTRPQELWRNAKI